MIMKSFIALALSTLVAADSSDFPSDNTGVSSCHLDADFPSTDCDLLYEEIDAVIRSYATGDAAGGKYSIYEESDSDPSDTYVWSVRQTGGLGLYYDDQIFELTQSSSGTCQVTGKSRSQSPSYYDYDTNYCNLWNVYNAIGGFTNLKKSDCLFYPKKPSYQCQLY